MERDIAAYLTCLIKEGIDKGLSIYEIAMDTGASPELLEHHIPGTFVKKILRNNELFNFKINAMPPLQAEKLYIKYRMIINRNGKPVFLKSLPTSLTAWKKKHPVPGDFFIHEIEDFNTKEIISTDAVDKSSESPLTKDTDKTGRTNVVSETINENNAADETADDLNRNMPDVQKQAIIFNEYLDGESLKTLSTKYNVRYGALQVLIKQNNLPDVVPKELIKARIVEAIKNGARLEEINSRFVKTSRHTLAAIYKKCKPLKIKKEFVPNPDAALFLCDRALLNIFIVLFLCDRPLFVFFTDLF